MVVAWSGRHGRRVRWLRLVHAEDAMRDPNAKQVIRAIIVIFVCLGLLYAGLTVVLAIELFR